MYLASLRRLGKKGPDFLLHTQEEQIVIEVGGKGKGVSRFKGLEGGFRKLVLKDGPPYDADRKPIWALGLLAEA